MGFFSCEVARYIEDVEATSSKNEKVSLLKGLLDDALFEQVVVAAYDPYITYGVQKTPDYTINTDGASFNSNTWSLLSKLANRELTGNDALLAVSNELSRLSQLSAELFIKILRKDLRAGFGASSLNKAKKGLIKEFPYQRCSLASDVDLDVWPWQAGVISQEKADGMFTNIDNEISGVVSMTTRQGTPIPAEKFAGIIDEMQHLMTRGVQFHGEIVVVKAGEVCKRKIGNGILNHVISGGDFAEDERPVYLVWDSIPLSHVKPKGKYEVPYKQRFECILADLNHSPAQHVRLIPTRIIHSQEEADQHFLDMLQDGKEGTVIKHPEAIWKDGTSKQQLKYKLEVEVDLVIHKILPGKSGTRLEGRPGSLTCMTSCGSLSVDVTVKNEDMRNAIEADPDDWIDRVIVVKSNELMEPSKSNPLHTLYLPRMSEKHYRVDKEYGDSLYDVAKQFELKKMAGNIAGMVDHE
jgi:DNA ligase-1